MPYSQEKAKEIFEYVEKFGKEEAANHFNITIESARRASRKYRNRVDEVVEVKSETKTQDYVEKAGKIMSAFNNEGRVMDIEEYCIYYGLSFAKIRSYKLVSHTGVPFYNIVFHEPTHESDIISEEFLESMVKKHVNPIKTTINKPSNEEDVIRVIYTDTHIGMDTNAEGIAMYSNKWDLEEQKNRFNKMVEEIVHKSNGADKLIIDDLGDYIDGWNAQTVRMGHDLPQNMSNEQMFDSGVALKMMLVDKLVASGKFSSITTNSLVNDNHSGSSAYVVNSAVKSILEVKYGGLVKVNILSQFINHYEVGDHCFILSHGKDAKTLKFGFKPVIDEKIEKKITNYIMENKINSKFIEFSKGDSHQMKFDLSSSDYFNYMNYPSLAPSSEWVQTNFQKGRSGFVIQKFNKHKKDIQLIPITFN